MRKGRKEGKKERTKCVCSSRYEEEKSLQREVGLFLDFFASPKPVQFWWYSHVDGPHLRRTQGGRRHGTNRASRHEHLQPTSFPSVQTQVLEIYRQVYMLLGRIGKALSKNSIRRRKRFRTCLVLSAVCLAGERKVEMTLFGWVERSFLLGNSIECCRRLK